MLCLPGFIFLFIVDMYAIVWLYQGLDIHSSTSELVPVFYFRE